MFGKLVNLILNLLRLENNFKDQNPISGVSSLY